MYKLVIEVKEMWGESTSARQLGPYRPSFSPSPSRLSMTMLSLLKSPRVIPSLTRSLASTSVSTSSLLLQSKRAVDKANDYQSDQLGDIMVKRWLGGAAAKGVDTDRVSRTRSEGRGRRGGRDSDLLGAEVPSWCPVSGQRRSPGQYIV